jgi:hypothetical protein
LPFLILRTQSNHRAALRAHEIVSRDTDGPAEPRGHADDLIGGVNRGRPPDLGDVSHFLDGCKHLEADHGGFEAKQAVQISNHAIHIERFR